MNSELLIASIVLLEVAALIYLITSWRRLWHRPSIHFKWRR